MTVTTLDQIHHAAKSLHDRLVAWRRDFHAHPELGFQEVRTAGIVARHLTDLGLEVTTGVGKTGVVALVEPDHLPADAPTVLLRFDMDALPIQEQTGAPYASTTPGVMHACGHDGHTAIGMGVATVLSRFRQELPGRVKLVFQPAEEGLGGAKAMINDGALDHPRPDAAFGLHLWSRLPLDQVVVQAGPLWAAANMFELIVHGRGGHGAMPHETVDATVIAAHILIAWQSIVSRNIDPTQTAVISVGSFHSGDVANVIAQQARLTGTTRCFDPQVGEQLHRRMREVAEAICAGFGATCQLTITIGIPATINDPTGTDIMREVATQIVGAHQVTQITPMMVGEDMSEFLNRAPGCFILVGAAPPGASELPAPHHNPYFDFDERMMTTGVALLSGVAVAYLTRRAATV